MVQWLGLRSSTAGKMGSVPGQGTKVLHAIRCGKKTKPKLSNSEMNNSLAQPQWPHFSAHRLLVWTVPTESLPSLWRAGRAALQCSGRQPEARTSS